MQSTKLNPMTSHRCLVPHRTITLSPSCHCCSDGGRGMERSPTTLLITSSRAATISAANEQLGMDVYNPLEPLE